MNAVYIHKRNESINRMWACLAGVEIAVLILSSGLASQETTTSIILGMVSLLAVVILVLAAPVQYILACEHYINARGSAKASLVAGVVLIVAIIASIVMSIVTCSSASIAFYVVLPVTFALSALPLKLIPDQA